MNESEVSVYTLTVKSEKADQFFELFSVPELIDLYQNVTFASIRINRIGVSPLILVAIYCF